MNKLKQLHKEIITNVEDDGINDSIEESMAITKDIAIKFRKWFNDNNYEFIDNTIVGDLYANREGSDSALTEEEIFNIFIEKYEDKLERIL